MHPSFFQTLFFLLLSVAIIIFLTARLRAHAFFALLIACFVMGIGLGMPVLNILAIAKEGLGNILKSLGFIIVLGTALGVLLEHSGCAAVIANFISRKTGKGREGLAMSITGFITGLPVFCDSGYIVLNGLNLSFAKKSGTPVVLTSISLATGLYAVHCLIPPHPGAAAAAASLNVDFGRLTLYGIILAIPAMLIGHAWSVYATRKMKTETPLEPELQTGTQPAIPVLLAILPIAIPILLITTRAFFSADTKNAIGQFFYVLGEPSIALAMGIIISFMVGKNWNKAVVSRLLSESADKAGGVLVVIGGGGAFGAILAAARIGDHFTQSFNVQQWGLLFPFLLTALLKTAQGSSTVAIITAASIVAPVLASIGFDDANGRIFCVLAMGAGSMVISHANDAYFWVISRFSGIEMNPMLKVYSVASALMGGITILLLWLASLFLH